MKTILVDAAYTFIIETPSGFKIFEPLQKMLDEYQNRKIILTSANDEQFKKFGLDAMPYEVFTLKHNPEKSDPRYYQTMLSQFNLQPEDVVYFEHSLEAVESAQSIGINTFHWESDKQPLEELKDFLDKHI